MKLPFFDRIFHFLTEERQRQKLAEIMRQYFFDNPVAILAVVLGGLSLLIALCVGRKARRWGWLCLASYTVVLLLLLVFSRYWQGDVRGWRPLGADYFLTEGGFHEGNVLITAANLLVFVPFGMLLQMAAAEWRFWQRLLLAVGVGFVVEGLQFLFARGYSSLRDVLAYTAGSLVGMGLVGLFSALARRRKAKRLDADAERT